MVDALGPGRDRQVRSSASTARDRSLSAGTSCSGRVIPATLAAAGSRFKDPPEGDVPGDPPVAGSLPRYSSAAVLILARVCAMPWAVGVRTPSRYTTTSMPGATLSMKGSSGEDLAS